ncbi:hypothetical protein MKX08_003161 [Trichoderma sp. CBMAI-0020]|nr:hypothetical protein MKX08_003161 [Trichoderma sp. CBMAI-0020]
MSSSLSPGKVLLLAAHYATHADIESLARLSSQQARVLHKELLLRILLTYLPETVKPSIYVGFLLSLARDSLEEYSDGLLDTAPVEALSEDEVSKRARKLHLQQLTCIDAPSHFQNDPISTFLIQRSYKMDSETGLLSQVLSLLTPFLSHSPELRLWITSTVVPYIRRNVEYYTDESPPFSLLEFQKLSDPAAVLYLLSRTGSREGEKGFIGRDIRGLIGPWIQGNTRWTSKTTDNDNHNASDAVFSAGWEQFLEWLTDQAVTSWTISVAVIEQWGGPKDLDLGETISSELTESQFQYLFQGYARAALASAYLISESTVEALPGAFQITKHIMSLLGHDNISPTLDMAVSRLPNMSDFDASSFLGMKTATYMRNDLLKETNPLTSPTEAAMALLLALIMSASICTGLGVSYSVRKAGDLAFVQDQREQKGEIAKLVRSASTRIHGDEDQYWSHVRNKILWLNTWGTSRDHPASSEAIRGIAGTVSMEFIETEILKALLSNSRYTLAKSIYEDSHNKPLAAEIIQDTVYQAALRAFDNASNPNRSRGGLKKCDEIIHSFPATLDKTHPATKRVEALLRCTHALSDYRLSLKQGEPFKPVVLRVHSDPISIIDKALEQNPKAYTRLPEFLEMAANMVRAGITQQARSIKFDSETGDNSKELHRAKKLIIASCIEAALREDDFETAYSYVVSRLETPSSDGNQARQKEDQDEWSWKAALKAGQYIRTEQTLLPTHLGIASGNPEIRHLEQRIECLATALRVAPTSQLQEILKTFRRCEEQLDSAINEEAAAEASWAGVGEVPGAFESQVPQNLQPARNMTATAASRQAEEAPMSLFDLSRATASVASRNFTKLSNLSSLATSRAPASPSPSEEAPRVRKRDQLREAATGTLVSGVGWLIGANVNREATET